MHTPAHGQWLRGVYASDRAAALSGVPKSTLYYWARKNIWPASLSDGRPKLWTYADLLGLRAIYWLRHDKPEAAASASSMRQVRRILGELALYGQRLGSPSVRILVDRGGAVTLGTLGQLWEPTASPGRQQYTSKDILDVMAEFPADEGRLGPDLISPRPHLRILPGKLSGEPHIVGTRIPSLSIAALARDGLNDDQILSLYPGLSPIGVSECLDLERQLQKNAA